MNKIKYRMYLKNTNFYMEGSDVSNMMHNAKEMGFRITDFDYEIFFKPVVAVDHINISFKVEY